jgi:DNA-3-methyladenine glycosylase
MDLPERLDRSFYARPVLVVARELLGMRLVRILDGHRLAGIIVETEAYRGQEDLACHARAGLTKRTAVMFGPPGHAYVYFTYGMHWLLNCITDTEGYPAAVLLRAILPTDGVNAIAAQRAGRPKKQWTNGPAKLTQSLSVDGRWNGHDLCASQQDEDQALFIERGAAVPDERIHASPRVGLGKTPEPWLSMPWRFVVQH